MAITTVVWPLMESPIDGKETGVDVTNQCIKPEAALKVRRHKTMEICNLCPDENYELILEWKVK